MIQWYLPLKLIVLCSLCWFGYHTFFYTEDGELKTQGKFKKWRVALVIVVAFGLLFSPIKLDTGTRTSQVKSNQVIANIKSNPLPPKVVDKSFKDKANSDIGIKSKDME